MPVRPVSRDKGYNCFAVLAPPAVLRHPAAFCPHQAVTRTPFWLHSRDAGAPGRFQALQGLRWRFQALVLPAGERGMRPRPGVAAGWPVAREPVRTNRLAGLDGGRTPQTMPAFRRRPDRSRPRSVPHRAVPAARTPALPGARPERQEAVAGQVLRDAPPSADSLGGERGHLLAQDGPVPPGLPPRPNIMSAMTRRPPGHSHCAARAVSARLSASARWCSA